MAKRQQLPPQIKKVEVARPQDRETRCAVPAHGRRREVRRSASVTRCAGGTPPRRKPATRCPRSGRLRPPTSSCHARLSPSSNCAADWLASLHNTRATTVNGYTYLLAPLRERHGNLRGAEAHPTRSGQAADRPARRRHTHRERSCAARVVGAVAEQIRRLLASHCWTTASSAANCPATSPPRCARFRASATSRRPTPLTRSGCVLRAADKDRSGHLWYLALSGLRRGELAGLMWSDIDLEAKTLSIDRVRVAAGAGSRCARTTPRRAHRAAHCPSTTAWSPRCAAHRPATPRSGSPSAQRTLTAATSPSTRAASPTHPTPSPANGTRSPRRPGCVRSGCTMLATPAAPLCICAGCRWL